MIVFNYAQINENSICFAVSTLSGVVNAENLIQIESYDTDIIYRKYENGQWSAEKFEPQSTAPLTEFEQLKASNAELLQRQQDAELMLADIIASQMGV